jgi:hypothetical protein
MRPSAKVVVPLAWAVGAAASLRLGMMVAADVRRYDRARAMSGDGPLLFELPAMLASVIAAERKALPQLFSGISSLPSDAVRYAKMKAM